MSDPLSDSQGPSPLGRQLGGALVASAVLILAAYFLWYLIRLGDIRDFLSYEMARLIGADLPWLELMMAIYVVGSGWYLLGWLRSGRLLSLQQLLAFLVILPAALPLLFISVKTWPMVTLKSPEDSYVLPGMVHTSQGSAQALVKWESGREQLLGLFRDHIYGHVPELSLQPGITALPGDGRPGKAGLTPRQSRLTFSRDGANLEINLLSYLPENARAIFLMANFEGNHSTSLDTDVHLSSSWVRNNRVFGVEDNRATEKTRGFRQSRWPLESILNRGYGLVTFHYGDVVPDNSMPQYGLPFLLRRELAGLDNPPGSISMWAWSYSRILDYLYQQPDTVGIPVIAAGHSRLGKTALWAAAQDERFAAAISNNSGCLGAALSRRRYGETIDSIVEMIGYWFTPYLETYRNNEQDLPVDQHQLLALIAPRPLYVASAEQDRWADPEGEYLAAAAASEVYGLYGLERPWDDQVPPRNSPVGNTLRYHMRAGGHDVVDYDWQQWLSWADSHFSIPISDEDISKDEFE